MPEEEENKVKVVPAGAHYLSIFRGTNKSSFIYGKVSSLLLLSLSHSCSLSNSAVSITSTFPLGSGFNNELFIEYLPTSTTHSCEINQKSSWIFQIYRNDFFSQQSMRFHRCSAISSGSRVKLWTVSQRNQLMVYFNISLISVGTYSMSCTHFCDFQPPALL